MVWPELKVIVIGSVSSVLLAKRAWSTVTSSSMTRSAVVVKAWYLRAVMYIVDEVPVRVVFKVPLLTTPFSVCVTVTPEAFPMACPVSNVNSTVLVFSCVPILPIEMHLTHCRLQAPSECVLQSLWLNCM
jgi:hypothetical protein